MNVLIGALFVTGTLLVAGTAATAAAARAGAPLTEAITSQLAGRTVAIECGKPRAWWGRVQGRDTASGRWIPGSTIELDSRLCAVLAQGSDAEMSGWTALAMLALAHEVAHIRGQGDEIKAQCYGLRHLTRFASAFGFSAEEAAWLRRKAAREIDGKILVPGCSVPRNRP